MFCKKPISTNNVFALRNRWYSWKKKTSYFLNTIKIFRKTLRPHLWVTSENKWKVLKSSCQEVVKKHLLHQKTEMHWLKIFFRNVVMAHCWNGTPHTCQKQLPEVFVKLSQNSHENTYSRVFSCGFFKIFKNTFSKEHLWTTFIE